MKPRKPLKRGAPPKRQKPLSRSGKRLVRRVVQRIKSTGKSRFPKRRCPELLAWIRGHLCTINRGILYPPNERCGYFGDRQRIEAAHLKTRGAGGYDRDNVIPLCPKHHDEQEGKTAAFEAKYGVDLKQSALGWTAQFDKQVALGWVPGETG